MTVTSSSVLRPNFDSFRGPEVVLSTGTTAWQVLDDGGAVTDYTGADDTTYVRVNGDAGVYTNGRVIVGLTLLGALTADQRIKQVRIRGRAWPRRDRRRSGRRPPRRMVHLQPVGLPGQDGGVADHPPDPGRGRVDQ